MPTIAKILPAFAAAAIASGACSTEGGEGRESAGAEPAAASAATILESSAPANGAVLSSAPEALMLTFGRPVRLAEVTVAGGDGMEMPMMIASAGANTRYSLPLDGVGRGKWTVRWRAVDEAGATHEGAFSFEVR